MSQRNSILSDEKALQAWSDMTKGKESGFFELYDHYSPQLLSFGKKRANRDLAKDALQETFAALWSSKLSLGQTTSPKNYLFATYRRKLVTLLEAQRKYTDADHAEFEQDETIGMTDQNEQTLRPILDKLSTNQREIIYLKFYQGMDYDEISDILDMNYQSARNLMSRAIKSIRSKLTFLLF